MFNNTDIATALAEKAGLDQEKSEAVVKRVFEVIAEALRDTQTVKIDKFGHFSVTVREPMETQNPRTGETIFVPGRRVTHFKAVRDLAGPYL